MMLGVVVYKTVPCMCGAPVEVCCCGDRRNMFASVEKAPDDAVFGLVTRFKADPFPKKVNVSVGAYRDDKGQPKVFDVVHKAEEMLLDTSKFNHEYLPIIGLPEFRSNAAKLAFGTESVAIKEGRVATAQAPGGTGALRVGAALVRTQSWRQVNDGSTEKIVQVLRLLGERDVLIPNPTWGNHKQIMQHVGLNSVSTYRYFHPKTLGLDFEGMLADIRAAKEGSIVLLHAVAHNPTGVDPTPEQWKEIASVVKSRSLVTFFDCAYQGFASGDLERDAFAIRLFVDLGMEFLLAQSFSKNMGLYGERVGAIHVHLSSADRVPVVESHLAKIIRGMYSNPPTHGARVVALILSHPDLCASWHTELKGVSGRILEIRQVLLDALKTRGTPGDWSHITKQIGMFTFTGLKPDQVQRMVETHHIYMLGNGRISLAGINSSNVDYIADAIHEVVSGSKL